MKFPETCELHILLQPLKFPETHELHNYSSLAGRRWSSLVIGCSINDVMDKREKMLIPMGSDCRHFTHQEGMHSRRAHLKELPEEERKALGLCIWVPPGCSHRGAASWCSVRFYGKQGSCYGEALYDLQKSGQKVLFGTNAKREMNYSVCREVSFRESVWREVF